MVPFDDAQSVHDRPWLHPVDENPPLGQNEAQAVTRALALWALRRNFGQRAPVDLLMRIVIALK